MSKTKKLLHTLSGQLGISIASNRMEQERRLLAVLQERNLIAQGLHDSIAQALTFLNLQVQMLESAFASDQREQAEENIGFIKDGVQECYEDVRELLMNFRTKISNKDFPEAVESLLARFERQTGIPVDLKWQDDGQALNYDEHLQSSSSCRKACPISGNTRVRNMSASKLPTTAILS